MTKRNRNPSYEDVLGIVENITKPIKGIDEPKIIADIEVEWGWNNWWNSKTLTFTRFASDWIWDFSFSWFWAQPTRYDIVAWRSSIWLACYSNGWYDSDGTEWCVSVRPNGSSQTETSNSTSVLRVFFTNAWWGDTRASHHSFFNDWIKLTFNASSENIKMRITCYF